MISYTYDSDGNITSESDFNSAASDFTSADYYTYNDADGKEDGKEAITDIQGEQSHKDKETK